MLFLVLCSALAWAEPAPNIVLIVSDDLGRADLSCYGCKDIQTPAIDALAKTGVRYTNAYSSSAVCSPSRAGIMTGRHPIRVNVVSNVPSVPLAKGLSASEVTLAEMLSAQGYQTGLFGKWHLGNVPDQLPNAQGFKEYFGCLTGCVDYFTHIHTYGTWRGHDLWRNGKEVREDGTYLTDLLTREATRFIDENQSKPFFMTLCYTAPHYPLQAPDAHFAKYQSLTGARQSYAAMVSALDESIGKVVGRLEERGLREKTLIIFTSDHGPSWERRAAGMLTSGAGSNAPYRGAKGSLFDGGIRVPLVISGPGWNSAGGKTDDRICSHLDIFPTLAGITGAKLDKSIELDGADLRATPATDRTLIWRLGKQSAIRRGAFKLVRVSLKEDERFLFDLSTDPGETKNLCEVDSGTALLLYMDFIESFLEMEKSSTRRRIRSAKE